VVRTTPTLVRLHIRQGYLASARRMLDELTQGGAGDLEELENLYERALRRAKVEAMRAALSEALARVRRARRCRCES